MAGIVEDLTSSDDPETQAQVDAVVNNNDKDSYRALADKFNRQAFPGKLAASSPPQKAGGREGFLIVKGGTPFWSFFAPYSTWLLLCYHHPHR